MFYKVLVATDLLETCDPAVLTAFEIAKINKGKLYILHVLESASTIYRQFVKHYKTGKEFVSNKEYKEIIKQAIEKNCAGTLKPYGNTEIKVTDGFPWMEILKWARKKRVDLILLGPHSMRAKEKGVTRTSGTIGSTVEAVIMHERSPVMIVNHSMSKKRLKFKKVMVSTDFSNSCAHALRFAIKLAQKHNSKIFLFHMLPISSLPKHSKLDYEAEFYSLEQKLEALCEKTPNGVDCEYGLWGGTLPHLEIEKFAEQNDVDLIVMGSHAKENEGKWYVGSAVEKVSLRSICPVIIVTDPISLIRFSP